MNVIKVRAKRIFTKTKIPGASWAINQYIGCQHSCLYCYAKFVQRWYDYGPWGTWVIVKENAPELARKYHPGLVVMTTVSDPYQPLEKELELTRKILENLDPRTRLSLLTKSDMVTRDIDLFSRFSYAEVGLTIGGFPREVESRFEPLAPSSKERIKALKALHESGIKTYTFISPIIPGINDVEKVIKETKDYSDFYWFEFLNLPASGSAFKSLLKSKFPEVFPNFREKVADEAERIREIARENGILVKGIVVHSRNWLK